MNTRDVMSEVEDLANDAADAALEVYEENFDVEYKKDAQNSPLTEADRKSHRIIVAGLEVITPDIPIVSEESDDNMEYATRKDFDKFWLVDPLDGTKEFVKKNDEFTVNIGLIDSGVPVAGVVVAPVPSVTYMTDGVDTVVKRDGEVSDLHVSDTGSVDKSTLVHSRSHSGDKIKNFIDTVDFDATKARGSSLKICMVAEGKADTYLRFNPTWEWDTAAADAILRMAGGKMTEPDGNTLYYNKESLKNPRGFLVTNSLLHENVIERVTSIFDEETAKRK